MISYTLIWLIIWLLSGKTTFIFGNGGEFWALVVALIADIFWLGWLRKFNWFNK